jgi:hypothetical protein
VLKEEERKEREIEMRAKGKTGYDQASVHINLDDDEEDPSQQ